MSDAGLRTAARRAAMNPDCAEAQAAFVRERTRAGLNFSLERLMPDDHPDLEQLDSLTEVTRSSMHALTSAVESFPAAYGERMDFAHKVRGALPDEGADW